MALAKSLATNLMKTGTNVYKLIVPTRVGPDSCIDPHEQAAFYDPGLGSRGQAGFPLGRLVRWIYRKVSQATGLGITRNIIDCYAAIIRLAKPDDRIFFFGFGRGAYTHRCVAAALFGLAGEIQSSRPIRRPHHLRWIMVNWPRYGGMEHAQLIADAEPVSAGLRSRRDAARHCHRSETVSGQGADRPHKPRYQFAHTTDARRVGWRA